MAHFYQDVLTKPTHFNFARDVVDYWAAKPGKMQAMLWISDDQRIIKSLSYEYFEVQSHRIAVLFERLGVGAGDVVLMMLPNIPEWWEITIATLRIGAVITPATMMLANSDIEFRCQQTRAKVFIGNDASVEKALRVRSSCPDLKTIICIHENAKRNEDVVDFKETMRSMPPDARVKEVKTKAEDPSIIFFTSGTSGPPKMVRHNQVSCPLGLTTAGKYWMQLEPGKMYWNISDLGWGKSFVAFMGAWNCGASFFVHDDRSSFKPTRLLATLHKYPITTLCAPPTAYRQLVVPECQNYLTFHPPQALEHSTGAGEPLNDSVITTWQKVTGVEIHDGYGQSETLVICANMKGNKIKPGSMGKRLPGVPMFIIDSQGEECAVGVEGDIAISRTKNDFFGLFDGYLRRDGTLDPSVEKRGGHPWHVTGDRGVKDGDGYFWFVSRSDDLINSSGYRIGPFEVESILKLHPAVVESAVVSSPDATRSEVIKAFIVLNSEYAAKLTSPVEIDALTTDIQDFCKRNGSPYKYPRKIQFVEMSFLPKTISGKIQRAVLKATEWKQIEKAKL